MVLGGPGAAGQELLTAVMPDMQQLPRTNKVSASCLAAGGSSSDGRNR